MMNQNPTSPQSASSMTQMFWAQNAVMIILGVPSLSVMLLFRRKLGFRTIQPWMLILIFLGLSMLGGGTALLGGLSGDFSPAHYLTTLAALLVTASGIFWRWQAWQGIKRGERWHTKSRGISYLHTVLPMLSEYIIQRYVEPAICFILGFILAATISSTFGLWLLFSGAALAVMESLISDMQLNTILDQLDGIVEGEIASEYHDMFTQTRPGITPPSIDAMSGITVGLAPELATIVAQRRAAAEARKAALIKSPDET